MVNLNAEPSSWYNGSTAAAAAAGEESDQALHDVLLVKRVFYTFVSPLVILVGVVGDALCVGVLSGRFLRRASVIYAYLRALACTDLAAHCSAVPMLLWIVDVRSCTQWAAFYYAHVGFPLANAFMATSVWIVVFITLGQYVAVCHPFVQTFRSRRMCFMLTMLAYCISFTIYLPWAWRKTVVHRNSDAQCPNVALDNPDVISSTWFLIYQWSRESISRFIPFLLILYFNARILCVYKRSKMDRMKVVGDECQKRLLRSKSDVEEKRLWFLLLAIMLVFFVCTLPAAPLTILVRDSREQHLPFQLVRAIGNLLEFTKFALNFYFYCMINRDIRRLFVYKLILFLRFFNKNICPETEHRYTINATRVPGQTNLVRRQWQTVINNNTINTNSNNNKMNNSRQRLLSQQRPDSTAAIANSHSQSHGAAAGFSSNSSPDNGRIEKEPKSLRRAAFSLKTTPINVANGCKRCPARWPKKSSRIDANIGQKSTGARTKVSCVDDRRQRCQSQEFVTKVFPNEELPTWASYTEEISAAAPSAKTFV